MSMRLCEIECNLSNIVMLSTMADFVFSKWFIKIFITRSFRNNSHSANAVNKILIELHLNTFLSRDFPLYTFFLYIYTTQTIFCCDLRYYHSEPKYLLYLLHIPN